MKYNFINALCFIFAINSAGAVAQETEALDRNKNDVALPYEIVITPNVMKRDLRKLLIQVEDDFFARFNELNLDDNYDVYCYTHTPTMSHIQKRQCEPIFMIRARGDDASIFFQELGQNPKTRFGNLATRALQLSPNGLRQEMNTDYEILQKKLEELNQSDLEFRSIGIALARLKDRLNNYGKD